MSKDFTPSERVAIGRALEGELQGRNLATLKQNAAVENFPQRSAPEGKTRDLAAKAAGFGNGKAIKRRKQIWEALHPSETGGQTFPTGARRADGTFGEGQKQFAASTSEATGMSKRAINQHAARAEGRTITGNVAGDAAAAWVSLAESASDVARDPAEPWPIPECLPLVHCTDVRGMGKCMGRKAKAPRKALVC